MLNAKLEMERSLISILVPDGAHMDAGAFGDLAGIEIAHAGTVNVTTPGASDYRAPHIASLSLARGDIERLFYLLAEKLGLPAFTEQEWRFVAETLRATEAASPDDDRPERLAERIEEAYR